MGQPIQQLQIIKPPFAKPITVFAAIYLRLSRDDDLQGESGSITNQRQLLTQYCKNHCFNIVGEYIDDGYSGTNFNRPGFQKMIDDIEDGKINCVIVKDLSRLGRDYIYTGQYTEIYFPAKGVRFIAVNDNIDSENGESEIAPFLNILNEMHARETSKKVKATFYSKYAAGAYIASFAPLGYIKDPLIKNHIIPDDETKAIIVEMFTMASHGMGPKRICTELKRKNIPAPSWWVYKKTGKFFNMYEENAESKLYRWTDEKVRRILTNPVYVGNSVHYKQTNVSFKNKKRIRNPEDKLFIVENTHEPLISKELWDLAQAHMEGRKRPTKQGEVNIFSGLLKCADCGHSMTYSSRKNKAGEITREFFSCKTYRKYGREECSIHSISYEDLYNSVKEKLQEFCTLVKADKEKFVSALKQSIIGQQESEVERAKRELANAEKRLKNVDSAFAKLYEERFAGIVTERNYTNLSARYQKEQEELEKKITELRSTSEKTIKIEENIEKWTDLIGQYDNITELTAPMLNELIDKIVVHEATTDENGEKVQDIEIFYYQIGKIE